MFLFTQSCREDKYFIWEKPHSKTTTRKTFLLWQTDWKLNYLPLNIQIKPLVEENCWFYQHTECFSRSRPICWFLNFFTPRNRFRCSTTFYKVHLKLIYVLSCSFAVSYHLQHFFPVLFDLLMNIMFIVSFLSRVCTYLVFSICAQRFFLRFKLRLNEIKALSSTPKTASVVAPCCSILDK